MNSRAPNGRHVLAGEIFQLVCKTVCVRHFSAANVDFKALLFLVFTRSGGGHVDSVFCKKRKKKTD